LVFTSDNGPQGGEAASALPYRGKKWSALEGGTRVPCIIHWPGVIPAGREFGGLVSAIDLLPTLTRASGIDLSYHSSGKPNIDGVDVWGALIGSTDESPRKELLLWHGMSTPPKVEIPPDAVPEPQAIRMGEWKLFFDRKGALDGMGVTANSPEQIEILAAYREELKDDEPNPPFLFNVNDDIDEIRDRSPEFPEKVEVMRIRAAAILKDIREGTILPLVKP